MQTADLYQVELRLQNWGKWRVMHINHLCQGAPNKSAFCAAIGQDFITRTYSSNELMDVEIEETDKHIKLLAKHNPELAEIVNAKYTSETNDFFIIKKLGIFRATYYRKLKAAKKLIAKSIKT